MTSDDFAMHVRFAGGRCCLPAITLVIALWGCGEGTDTTSVSVPLSPNPPLTIGMAEDRPARVVLPRDYDVTRRYPLVILLHGFGGDAAEQEVIFHLGQRTTKY